MEYEFEDCKESDKLRKDDLVILIMGPTGTGKSNIIDNLTGELGKRAGHGLLSCTAVIGAVRIKKHCKYGDRLVLVDTPGFDDTNKPDLEILRIISEWLVKLRQAQVFLCGIVYLHRITDVRMSGSHWRNLKMLGELCGSANAKKVAFVTTMWDDVEPMSAAEMREDELKNTYWSSMLNLGASTARFHNTGQSAWNIIDNILEKPIENIALQMQQERVTYKKPLEETEAAKRLDRRNPIEGSTRTKECKATEKNVLSSESLDLQAKASDDAWGQYQFINNHLELNLSSYMNLGQSKKITTEELSPDDFIIAVMGPSGSGKTTFINKATGLHSGGHDQRKYTTEIGIFKLSVPGLSDTVVFVDTPGFDDSDKSDAETLKMVGDWFAKIYRQKILLSGILYFHRISDNRMSNSSLKNLTMFEALCGKNMLQNMVLTTTMWGEVNGDIAAAREEQLKEMYWAPMLERGTTTKRFVETKESAFQVLETLFKAATYPQPLLIQQEMVDQFMQLNETSAGKKLYSDLRELARKHQGILRRMRAQLKGGDSGNSIVLKEEYKELKEFSNLLAYNIQQFDLSLGQRMVRVVATAFGLKLR